MNPNNYPDRNTVFTEKLCFTVDVVQFDDAGRRTVVERGVGEANTYTEFMELCNSLNAKLKEHPLFDPIRNGADFGQLCYELEGSYGGDMLFYAYGHLDYDVENEATTYNLEVECEFGVEVEYNKWCLKLYAKP